MRQIILILTGTLVLVMVLIAAFLWYSIRQSPVYHPNATVSVRQTAQGYQLMCDQQPYEIRGVAGYTYLSALKAVGGNTIRTWDTEKIGEILDSAQLLGLKVIVGLPLPGSREFDYHDDRAVEAMLRSVLATVVRYRDHPALLMWGVGNEVVFYPNSLAKLAVYRTLNRAARQIKATDPNHPTTTMLLYSRRGFILSQFLLPDLDILSYNVFGRLYDFRNMLRWYVSQKPYLITEWGINGPWEEEQTSWGAPLENSSYGKYQQLIERNEQLIPKKDGACLGSLLFYWGSKFEITPTWFSAFTPRGNPTHMVDVVRTILQPSSAQTTAPQVAYVLLNQQGGRQNILASLEDTLVAKAVGESASRWSYQWEIRAESIAHESSLDEHLQPKPIPGLMLSEEADSCQFRAPKLPGAYRLYVYVSDDTGHTATANVPFYVVR